MKARGDTTLYHTRRIAHVTGEDPGRHRTSLLSEAVRTRPIDSASRRSTNQHRRTSIDGRRIPVANVTDETISSCMCRSTPWHTHPFVRGDDSKGRVHLIIFCFRHNGPWWVCWGVRGVVLLRCLPLGWVIIWRSRREGRRSRIVLANIKRDREPSPNHCSLDTSSHGGWWSYRVHCRVGRGLS